MGVQLGDVASWLGATAVAGTLVAALYQIRTERLRRHAQELDLAQKERRRQAELISGWLSEDPSPPQPTVLALLNRSDAPVYEAVVTMVFIQGSGHQKAAILVQGSQRRRVQIHELTEHVQGRGEEPVPPGYRRTLIAVPPGLWRVEVPPGWHGMSRRPGVEIAFTDRAGVHWIRRANGHLQEINKPGVDYYGLARPLACIFRDLVSAAWGSGLPAFPWRAVPAGPAVAPGGRGSTCPAGFLLSSGRAGTVSRGQVPAGG
jgi:hypothetical protein